MDINPRDVTPEVIRQRGDIIARNVSHLTATGTGRPSREVLERAPLISAYTVLTDGDDADGQPMRYLRGIASGHPRMPGLTPATTSYVLASGNDWVLTVGRYWRLGRPADLRRPLTPTPLTLDLSAMTGIDVEPSHPRM